MNHKTILVMSGSFIGSSLLSSCVLSEGANALVHYGSGTFETMNRQRQLERVARDWCLTIRASQVIPVYPLREDIEPGRMMVVTGSISKLKSHWNSKGYMPIEPEFDRLTDLDIAKWYRGSFGTGKITDIGDMYRKTNWASAPYAGFPSYSYTVKRGEGFSGALPVQGVPMLLSAVNARSASVSVTLKDARTYGIGESQLRDAVNRWIAKEDNRYKLYHYTDKVNPNKSYYLRVITRVYLVSKVNVSVSNLASAATDAKAGAEYPVGNLAFGDGEVPANYQAALGALSDLKLSSTDIPEVPAALPEDTTNPVDPRVPITETQRLNQERKRLELAAYEAKLNKVSSKIEAARISNIFGGTALPGGHLKLVSASKGSISMDETFPRPIVIGYEAVEYEIKEDARPSQAALVLKPYNVFRRIND